jgi:hypothetical protein
VSRLVKHVAGLCLSALLVAGCSNPLEEGCQYATGLTKKCSVAGDGKWAELPPGFPAEELSGSSDKQVAAAALALTVTATVEATAAPRVKVDDLDRFIISRYLLQYSDHGTSNDCLVADPNIRNHAYAELTAIDPATNRYRYLQLGPPSRLTSKVFEATLVAADIKVDLAAKFAKVLGDKDKGEAAAQVAFAAMKKRVASDFAAGTYRYVVVRSHPQVWQLLQKLRAIRPECEEFSKSVLVGIVVVGIYERKRLVEDATDASFSSDFEAGLTGIGLPAGSAATLTATARAVLSVKIQTSTRKLINVELDAPTIVPLCWKADKLP